MSTIAIESILSLASKGFRMHPLQVKDKVPVVKGWEVKATCDPNMIRQWFAIHRNCNWGLATGHESNVFVVDIDVKASGDKTWKKLLKLNGPVETVQVRTGSGGMHYYFQYPKSIDIRNSASKVGKGIDIRGEGGQVVIPPSIHPNGTPYSWEPRHSPDDLHPAKAPKWLLQLIKEGQAKITDAIPGGPVEKGDRNNQIFYHALALAEQKAEKSFALTVMRDWVREQGEDVPDDEIIATVNKVYEYNEERKQKHTAHELTDYGNAQRILARSGKIMKYVVPIGWHIWDGRCWAPDLEELQVRKIAADTISEFEEELKQQLMAATDRNVANAILKQLQFAVNSHNIGKITAAVESCKYDPRVFALASSMDDERSTYLLNCLNGTLDLRTCELKPHDPDLLITKLAPVEYDPKAKCPTFLQTMHYAFGKDKEMVQFVQRALGYSLSASLNEQCFFICYGPKGANGKTTILEAVQTILGEGIYAKTSSANTITSSARSGDGMTQSSLAALRKIRFASVNEFSASATLDEELLKRLTGGDSIEARYLYKEVFTFKPCFKIWIRANNEPNIKEVGEAFWRRLVEIPFEFQIPEEKRIGPTEISLALQSESKGILAWMVEGFQDWWKNGGLRKPEKVKAAGLQYRKDADVFEQFLSENTVEEVDGYVSRKELYNSFRNWCYGQGIKYVMTHRKFSDGIANKLDQHKQLKQGTVPIWRGITLTSEAQMDMMAQ
jgi:putative DNA primase/helicase